MHLLLMLFHTTKQLYQDVVDKVWNKWTGMTKRVDILYFLHSFVSFFSHHLRPSRPFQQVNVFSCAFPGFKMYVANLCGIHEVPCGCSVFKLLCYAVRPVSKFQKKNKK